MQCKFERINFFFLLSFVLKYFNNNIRCHYIKCIFFFCRFMTIILANFANGQCDEDNNGTDCDSDSTTVLPIQVDIDL